MIDQTKSLSLKDVSRPLWADRLGLTQLSLAPDLGSNRRLVTVAALTTLLICIVLGLRFNHIRTSLGDTDDAMRLVLVRSLLGGHGWFDQWVGRLQPPFGVYLHWSRLIDGALAGAIWLFERFLSPAQAELAVRFIWPLLWIFPAVVCALSTARSLGGRPAVLVCALLCLTNLPLYIQFLPGRVDHHNVQIVLALIAAACAMAPTRRSELAVVAGVATGLGLAIGIEALVFHALVGLSYGLRLAQDREDAPVARAYALSLAVATLMFFGAQTPPWRWSLPFCDAIGLNLAAAVAVAGFGLATVASLARRMSDKARVILLLTVGLAAAAAYLGPDPHCLEGPFGDVAPGLRSIWFDRINELATWPKLWVQDRGAALGSIAATALGVAGAAALVIRRWPKPTGSILLACALVAVAGAASAFAARMESYALWFGVPVIAAAVAEITILTVGNLLAPIAVASLLISPYMVGQGLNGAVSLVAGPSPAATTPIGADCSETDLYRSLAALPPGIVLSHIDLGPFVLANTNDSALAAPYLVTWGILASHHAFASSSAAAQAQVRALRVTYVVECRSQPAWIKGQGLEADLRRGRTPDWLQSLSAPNQVLQIYRVRPPLTVSEH